VSLVPSAPARCQGHAYSRHDRSVGVETGPWSWNPMWPWCCYTAVTARAPRCLCLCLCRCRCPLPHRPNAPELCFIAGHPRPPGEQTEAVARAALWGWQMAGKHPIGARSTDPKLPQARPESSSHLLPVTIQAGPQHRRSTGRVPLAAQPRTMAERGSGLPARNFLLLVLATVYRRTRLWHS